MISILDYLTIEPLVSSRSEGKKSHGVTDMEHAIHNSLTGDRYIGQLKNGLMDGIGKYYWADGTIYEGEFKDNNINGRGLMKWINNSEYEGEFIEGVRSGIGTLFNSITGCEYKGEFKNGVPNGYGTMFYDLEKTCYYDGQWKLGLKSGYGKMFYKSGNIYSGEWNNNLRHGKGKMIWESEEYDGEWVEGIQQGFGIYIWKMDSMIKNECNKFEGNWFQGKRSGFGIYKYSNGSIYEGQFLDNMKNGIGCFISERGNKILGIWKNDLLISQKIESLTFDKPYNFNLKGLFNPKCWSTEYEQLENQQLNKVFLRYITPLRKLYNYYTTTNLELEKQIFKNPRNSDNWCLSRLQLWNLIKDMKLEKFGISIVDMNRFYAQIYKNDIYYSHRYHKPHFMEETFTLFEFFEFLIRLSYLIYGIDRQSEFSVVTMKHYPLITFSKINNEGILSSSLSKLLKNDVIPNLPHEVAIECQFGEFRGQFNVLNELSKNQDMKNLNKVQKEKELFNSFQSYLHEMAEKEFRAQVINLYDEISTLNKINGLEDCLNDKTVFVRELIYFLNDRGFLNISDDDKLLDRLLEFFAQKFTNGILKQDNGNCFQLDYEIIPTEFFEFIYCLAFSKFEILIKKNLLPLMMVYNSINVNNPDLSLDEFNSLKKSALMEIFGRTSTPASIRKSIEDLHILPTTPIVEKTETSTNLIPSNKSENVTTTKQKSQPIKEGKKLIRKETNNDLDVLSNNNNQKNQSVVEKDISNNAETLVLKVEEALPNPDEYFNLTKEMIIKNFKKIFIDLIKKNEETGGSKIKIAKTPSR